MAKKKSKKLYVCKGVRGIQKHKVPGHTCKPLRTKKKK